MAMTNCKECGGVVAASAAVCPGCGYQRKRRPFGCFTFLMIVLLAAALLSLVFDAVDPPPQVAGSGGLVVPPLPRWQHHVAVDELDGTEDHYVATFSASRLIGRLGEAEVVLGYTCGKTFYLRAEVGFAVDRFDCGYSPCTGVQNIRVRFDDAPPVEMRWLVWQKTNEGATLASRHTAAMMAGLRGAQRLSMEVEGFGSDGRAQVLRYNLLDFEAALAGCP